MLKTKIYGGLCLGTLIVLSASYLQVFDAQRQGQDHLSGAAPSQTVGSNLTGIFDYWLGGKKEVATATSLSAVGFKGCHWCEVLKKETLPVLKKEGYNVQYVDRQDWKGPKIKIAPTLFYMDSKGQIVRKEVGFQTAEHVKKWLSK